MSGPAVFLAAGAVKTAVEALLAQPGVWGPETPRVHFGTVGALRDRILAGEAFDVAVLSDEAMEQVAERGLVARATILRLGVTGIGMAVRAGLALPAIDTEAGLLAALEAARSIAWADPAGGATAGRHFAGVIAALGIEAKVRAKSRLFPFGVEAVAACERGEADLAVSQATEIVGRPHVRLLGLLPPPHALRTGYSIAAQADNAAARAVIAAMTGDAGRAALAAIGFSGGDA
jgi:molybdate transport system substrate-binding protein